jgi:hypothetical protein
MRAITDQRVLLARAAVARSALGDLAEAGVAADAALAIDLAWRGFHSPDRAKAYESASILTREYRTGWLAHWWRGCVRLEERRRRAQHGRLPRRPAGPAR